MNSDTPSEQPESDNNTVPKTSDHLNEQKAVIEQPVSNDTQKAEETLPVVSQNSQPVQPQPITTAALHPQVQIPAVSVPNSAPTSVALPPVEEGEKTLSLLHKHEHPASLIVIAATLCFSLFNIGWAMHVRTARHTAYEQLPQVLSQTAMKNFGPEVESRPSGTLDMSKKINNLLTSKNEFINAGLGQQVNLSDGISFIITSIQKNWHSAVQGSLLPVSGDYYIKLNMIVGNRNNQIWGLNVAQTEAVLNGRTIPQVVYFPLAGSSEFGNGQNDLSTELDNLDPGQTISGALVIQVPANSLPDVLIQDQSYTYTSQSVIMKAQVKL